MRAAVRLGFLVMAAGLLAGCSGLLDPQGPIAGQQRTLLFNAFAIMMVVVGPVIVMALGFAWWFRAGNTRAKYAPDWAYSGQIELVVWAVPAMIVILVGAVGWIGSHQLDPPKPIVSNVKPLPIQVVALDWKWLFIYPEQGVATVNQLVVPEGTPLQFELTSYTVMNAFLVPQLGSMIYAMPGMATKLNLQADRAGEYPGLSSHFSGDHFSDMRFVVRAVKSEAFAAWVEEAKAAAVLDEAAMATLAKPGPAKVQVYKDPDMHLFDTILEASTRAPGSPGAPGYVEAKPGRAH